MSDNLPKREVRGKLVHITPLPEEEFGVGWRGMNFGKKGRGGRMDLTQYTREDSNL